jgi:hypothetical protein
MITIKTVRTNGVVDLKQLMILIGEIEDTYKDVFVDIRHYAQGGPSSFEIRIHKGIHHVAHRFQFTKLESMKADTIPATLHNMVEKLLESQREWVASSFRLSGGILVQALDDMKKLRGLPPYNETNPCYGDGYFAASLERKYGCTLEELAKAVKIDKHERRWKRACANSWF